MSVTRVSCAWPPAGGIYLVVQGHTKNLDRLQSISTSTNHLQPTIHPASHPSGDICGCDEKIHLGQVCAEALKKSAPGSVLHAEDEVIPSASGPRKMRLLPREVLGNPRAQAPSVLFRAKRSRLVRAGSSRLGRPCAKFPHGRSSRELAICCLHPVRSCLLAAQSV